MSIVQVPFQSARVCMYRNADCRPTCKGNTEIVINSSSYFPSIERRSAAKWIIQRSDWPCHCRRSLERGRGGDTIEEWVPEMERKSGEKERGRGEREDEWGREKAGDGDAQPASYSQPATASQPASSRVIAALLSLERRCFLMYVYTTKLGEHSLATVPMIYQCIFVTPPNKHHLTIIPTNAFILTTTFIRLQTFGAFLSLSHVLYNTYVAVSLGTDTPIHDRS